MSATGPAPLFTERQLAAIEHEDGPMEVVAGPGTGKTALLTERHARLIEKGLAWDYDILSLTFTRQAAAEMRERLQLRLDRDVDRLPIRTIHAHARLILASERAGQEEKKNLRLYDPAAAFRILRRAMLEAGLPETAWPPRFVAEIISDAKERGLSPAELVTVPDSPAQKAVARAYARYQELLDEEGAFDFDDLLLAATRLLETKPELTAQLHEQHRFIQVDEWQDTSLGQYRFIRLLTGADANLFVVGSPAQAIYEWRQANYARLAEQFYGDFPQARMVVLDTNFRSREPILAAAQALFDDGQYPDIALLPVRGPGEPVCDERLLNEYDEAAFVAVRRTTA